MYNRENSKFILPDAKYGSVNISKFINMLMFDGKKEVAEKIFYGAVEKIESKLIEKYSSVAKAIDEIILIVGPSIETKTKRIGGSNYQIPTPVSDQRRVSLGIKMIISAARNKKGSTMILNLSRELAGALDGNSDACKAKANKERMVASYRAYAHLA
jgi:small subunit ribosomal protein S7